jgi:hypothetical protein
MTLHPTVENRATAVTVANLREGRMGKILVMDR